LCRDNTPSILLCEWEVESDYLEDDRITGVMPVLFANDPKAAEAGMMDNLATARKDLDKINRAFFVPESLDIEEAAKVAKKPRLGDAEFLYKDWNLYVYLKPRFPPRPIQVSGIYKSSFEIFIKM
jgi:hypothetical protein